MAVASVRILSAQIVSMYLARSSTSPWICEARQVLLGLSQLLILHVVLLSWLEAPGSAATRDLELRPVVWVVIEVDASGAGLVPHVVGAQHVLCCSCGCSCAWYGCCIASGRASCCVSMPLQSYEDSGKGSMNVGRCLAGSYPLVFPKSACLGMQGP